MSELIYTYENIFTEFVYVQQNIKTGKYLHNQINAYLDENDIRQYK